MGGNFPTELRPAHMRRISVILMDGLYTMLKHPLLRKTTVVMISLFGAALLQTGRSQQAPATERRRTYPDAKLFLPASAVLTKEIEVDFEKDGNPDIVMAYAVAAKRDAHLFDVGVRILKYSPVSGWTVAFEQTHASVDNGGGPADVITVDEVTSSAGQHGAIVILRTSGAGTATDWYVFSSTEHKISKLDAGPQRAKVLAARGYQDWGYNDVKSNNGLIVETQPGFSRTTARCCPDKPSIEMTFRFTGLSITLESVRDLPFHPAEP